MVIANKDVEAGTDSASHEPECCPRCGFFMVEAHCRVACVNCGYLRDCNDQW
ncbi:TPA: hypothetical protein HA231_02675 [Candidatus Woesearchaeota archaeon]|nr:hypothetical protein [Candidatus Woesearchaeota archaeon]